MGVKIDKISVKDLGPIKDFSAQFGLFNLIYSLNEEGKTFLTEFIIRSLFKYTNRWSYLRGGGTGKIWISGLDENPIEFSPSSIKKLEDYLESDERGLPTELVNLLVVKGGEAEIEDTKGGISKNLIKNVLSGIKILDRIDNDSNISKTVKSAEIKNGKIKIAKRGEGEDYTNLRNELSKIEKLFKEIESKYKEGIVATYKIEEESLKERLEDLSKGKRHEAYLISEKIKGLEKELSKIPEDELDQVGTYLSLYRSKKESYKNLEEDYKEELDKSKDFSWLQNALSNYKELTTKVIKKPSKILLYIGSAILAVITSFLILSEQKNLSIISFLCTLAFFGVYIWILYKNLKLAGQNQELNNLKKEFMNRTGKELSDIALLETVLDEQREHNNKSDVIRDQLGDLYRELKNLCLSIQNNLITLTGEKIEESEWNKITAGLKRKQKGLKKEIKDEEKKLYKLGVDETDYLQENTGIKYSQEECKKIEEQLTDIQNKIKIHKDELNDLKVKVITKTGDDPSINWSELIENLHKKRQERQEELKKVTAKIIAGIAVHKVISQLRVEEDAKIQEGLESKTVLKPLKDLTKRYNKLKLDDDKLVISDKYNNFDLRDISTGAIEQIMLALRIGFSSKLLKKDTIFLILDDAFQHCDWPKREVLVRELSDIAKKGWQIIYLTMDDNIKELFDKFGKELKEDYISLKL